MEIALNLPNIIEKYRDRLIVAVTGDLTTSAEPPAYEAVNNYLRNYPFVSSKLQVGLRLQGIQDRIFFVPGNHDIWLYGNWFTRWKGYPNRREQYQKYFPEKLPNAYPLVVNGVSITAFTIDTNCVKKSNPFNLVNVLGKGEVGKEQIAEIQTLHNSLLNHTFQDIPDGFDYPSSLKIALMHHHLALPSDFHEDIQQKFLELNDSPSVLNLLCDIGVRLVLCGHQHFPYHISNLSFSNYPGHTIFLSCAGSATQIECKRNSFSAYEITRSGNGYNLRLLIYEADPKNYSYSFSVKSDLSFVI
jgi:3',5'-cyclic AMP phosphodiesterase CpdA